MMPLAIEVLALKLLISFLGLPISYLYYIVGEKQFTTIKFKTVWGLGIRLQTREPSEKSKCPLWQRQRHTAQMCTHNRAH